MELLEWITRNANVAFWIGVFLLLLVFGIGRFFIRLLRSITGNYPPATICACEHKCEHECTCNCDEDDEA